MNSAPRIANAPTVTPTPIPAFAPDDSPEEVFGFEAAELVEAAPLVVGVVEGLADREIEEEVGEEVVEAKSAAFHRIETPYAFNPPAWELFIAYVVVLVPFTDVNINEEPGRFDALTVQASVEY